ncbi:beta-1,6-N-acetylglucosaminyltransferase [Pedobacter sp. L105]|uniref:beta-1,6-N-acetylglucosaminyltransferase n=1 Tax=Pedobacter sp. L105 TaxID=1641871 RepID=UPI00131C75B3|nr:beta-1,6-N-acetylglucosaminyltransferase [Pedobacter sp. L105]
MKIACLIVTYTSAAQTRRMIEMLNNGQFDFYIHLDKKVDIATHKDLFNIPNVYFITDRVDVQWAAYSTVQAAFNGIKQIIASNITYDYINLITGQDYPIKSAAYIQNFLSANIGKQFIEYKNFDTDWEEAKARIEKYHFTNLHLVGKHRLEKVVNFFTGKRKPPIKLNFYGVSTFWTLSPECALYVVNYVEKNSALKSFLKYTWGSDEFIFQTVLMNSPYKDVIVNNNYRYVDWSAGGARPKFLKSEDFEKIIASDAFFGRKFNIDIDSDILDKIDEWCKKNQD